MSFYFILFFGFQILHKFEKNKNEKGIFDHFKNKRKSH
jgi:hypothetical protein